MLPNKNNIPLTPLHDLATNRPIRNFPRHERDIRTMALVDVVQCLQALDVSSLGLSGGEKKARLRGEVGLVKEEKRLEEKETVVPKKESTPTPADKARTNTENAKKAAEVRRKVLEAKQKKLDEGAGKGKAGGGGVGEAGKN